MCKWLGPGLGRGARLRRVQCRDKPRLGAERVQCRDKPRLCHVTSGIRMGELSHTHPTSSLAEEGVVWDETSVLLDLWKSDFFSGDPSIEHYGNWVCRPTTSLRERRRKNNADPGSPSKRQELGYGTESRSIPAQSKPTTC